MICQLCEGHRDVQPRQVQGVDLRICRWCWQKYGPASDPARLDVAVRLGETTPAERQREVERQAALERDRNRYRRQR